jgi:hypothetical protein
VILVKKKASDESNLRFAIKVMKKSHIINYCSITYITYTQMETLPLLRSIHLLRHHWCFQTRFSSVQTEWSASGVRFSDPTEQVVQLSA